MKSFIKSLLVFRYAGWSVAILLLTYFIIKSYQFGGNDFANSYFGAYFLAKNQFDITIFDPYTFNRRIYDEGYRGIFACYSPNPPTASIFFIPFSYFTLDVAKLLFNILSCVLFLLAITRLCRHINVNVEIALLFVVVAFFLPIRNHLFFGQSYFLIFALLAEGYLGYVNKSKWTTPVLWSVAILIKVFPVIVLLFLILRKEWRHVFRLAGVCILILFISVAWQGVDVWREYLLVILPKSNSGEIQAAYHYSYQSALMLAKFLFVREEWLNPHVLVNSSVLFRLSLIFFSVMILTVSTPIIQRNGMLSFGVTLLCSLLISPYGSTYSSILLLFIFIAVLKENNVKRTFVIGILIFLICNTPTSWFVSLPLLLRFPRLILMCILLVVLYYYYGGRLKVGVAFIYTGILTLPLLFQATPKQENSRRLISSDEHLLIFDYGVKADRIFYKYWYGEPKEFVTGIRANKLTCNSVYIKDNQIFYKSQQITHTSDSKIKPCILDDKYIVYLSDMNQGVGLYTLRYLPLSDVLMELE